MTTLGFEKRWNPMLRLERDAFIEKLADSKELLNQFAVLGGVGAILHKPQVCTTPVQRLCDGLAPAARRLP
jgi:hypothetical protein